ncbi:dihydroxyacetone kinase subunit DhaL [Flaviflexus huanghaiensis]|uniref:dihydroxyacetone kinase subunit DhaL n=1 Tax=Flaviflexus huanghaiensis TaxID=1111473 RepID=UPI0015FC7E0A|nr:dihydroxyacetone kinase subunit DhaL [Flaviflexus huanghaiensis]
MTTTDQEYVEYVVRTAADTAIANEDYFCRLDSVVGDGDFGYSLARGFERLLEQWDEIDRSNPAIFLQKTAMILTSRIGGSSGPIWGTAFMRASAVARKHPEFTAHTVVEMIRSAIEGIQARGGAELGDKTLLDALAPMADAIEERAETGASGREIAEYAAKVCDDAAEATKELMARRGRASYTSERSIGSVDAGAKGVAVIVNEIAKNWPES